MRRSVTFIHAADLHLGAPFKGLRSSSPEWADKMVNAIPEAFKRIISLAIDDQVDFVVFPGDLFDMARPSYADFALFVEGLKQLDAAGIPVYFCTGNHDPYVSWRHDLAAMPKNVHMFSAEGPSFFLFERDNEPLVALGGRGFKTPRFPEDEDISEGISRADARSSLDCDTPFVVGVLHSGLDIDPTRAPVPPSVLYARGVDYWALGHVHQVRLYPDVHPIIAYSGCPQGRAIREVGPHGVLKVTLVEGEQNEVEFIPTAQIEWNCFDLDVTPFHTIEELQEGISNKQFALNAVSSCRNMIFRVTLVGVSSLRNKISSQVLSDIREILNNRFPFFYIDSIVDETKPALDLEKLRNEGLFPAALLTAVDQTDSKQMLKVMEKGFENHGISLPASLVRNSSEVKDDATTLVLDLLERGSVK